ncbi:hypothetical protein [Streptomyces sp. NPDC047315]|uniref:hypothetical protein n=1 Tax=Streptomyces sp. NPDC047315 TaxID=3155142 RepID=UPI0033E35318
MADQPTETPVLVARNAVTGAPFAVLAGHSCHPVRDGGDGLRSRERYRVSADYCGHAAERVQQALGAPTLFFQGTAGGLNPEVDPGMAGTRLAHAITAIVRNRAHLPVTGGISCQLARVALPLALDNSDPGLQALRDICQRRCTDWMDKPDGEGAAARHAERMLPLIHPERLPMFVPMWLQRWPLGGLTILTMNHEVVSRYHLAMKQRFPGALRVMAHSNGTDCYVPSDHMLRREATKPVGTSSMGAAQWPASEPPRCRTPGPRPSMPRPQTVRATRVAPSSWSCRPQADCRASTCSDEKAERAARRGRAHDRVEEDRFGSSWADGHRYGGSCGFFAVALAVRERTMETEPFWSIPLAGGTVRVPSTPAGVRARLDPGELPAFEERLERTPGQRLVFIVLDAGLPPAVRQRDPDTMARLMEGDFTGVTDETGEQVHLPEIDGDSPVWFIPYTGQGTVEVPATIAGVHERLDGTRRAAFDAEVASTPAHQLPFTILQHATPAEVAAETDAVVAQLRPTAGGHGDEAVA